MIPSVEQAYADVGLLGLYDAARALGYFLFVTFIGEELSHIELTRGSEHFTFESIACYDQAWEHLAKVARQEAAELLDRYLYEGTSYFSFEGGKVDKLLCCECSMRLHFGGSASRINALMRGEHTDFKDIYGYSLNALHDESNSLSEKTAEEWYPDGLYCDRCEQEIIPPHDMW